MDESRLADLAAIRQLKARYWVGVDTADRSLLNTVFAPDAVIPAYGDITETRPAAQFIDNLITMFSQARSLHLGGEPIITFTGDDSATGIWPLEDRIWADEGASLKFRTLHGWGHYHDDYVRTAQGWRIHSFRLHRIRTDIA